MIKFPAVLVVLLSVLIALALPSQAVARPGDVVHAELRPGWRQADGSYMAALHLRLAPGWKTYWRVAGEAGLPPRIDWSASQNLQAVRTHWPRPDVFEYSGYRSIGFFDELVLPIEFIPARADAPMAIAADVTIGVCLDVCVPVDLQVSAALRGQGAPDPQISAALNLRATAATAAGLRGVSCDISPDGDGLRLRVGLEMPALGPAEVVVIEAPGSGLWVSDAKTARQGDTLHAEVSLRGPRHGAVALDRSALRITVMTVDRMVEHRGCTAG
ncbi:protein-disulfide reductase DsbD domain-containing protein [Roseicitreum antarcticum]|uniref:Thiol-disulfide interchange protein, contains DsbC and DsbD domains n=1 Tax=Roseicitreum antarcticum TaxID=564137 RepID=A0A1H2S928_9RHOB|nr:protein-disulfide reductase DsbD domain-containing protein [Roseicitreum antarcticum]SDW28142.1 Thiol-disulfide interchange protein, contains DsbC and DsbD domains [Roseicitreum antarcticum]